MGLDPAPGRSFVAQIFGAKFLFEIGFFCEKPFVNRVKRLASAS
jgi:hypothetical protein